MAGIFNTLNRVANQFQSLQQSIGSEFVNTIANSNFSNLAQGARSLQGIAQGVSAFASSLADPSQLIAQFRSRNIFPGAEPQQSSRVSAEIAGGQERDWRVRLSIPGSLSASPMFSPLKRTAGFVFPYTPTIYVQHSADYNNLQPVHSNYPFPVYESSRTDQFTVSGEFLIETAFEAEYWVAAVHFLRTITKMDYGGTGAPPPICRLNGYGDFVFNNVPVVITNFQIDLPSEVDYISTSLENQGVTQNSANSGAISWVPSQSLISITLQPIYSRRKVETFNLNNFMNGGYISGGDGFI